MPGMYAPGDYDLAGFSVGAAERGQLLPRDDVKPGDIVLGLPSTGVHSNGYSLVRKLVENEKLSWEDEAPFNREKTVAEAFLEPTKIYVKPLLEAIRETGQIKALAHITGGGLTENIPRVLNRDVTVQIDMASWSAPRVFNWLKSISRLETSEFARTFNAGIGMVAVVPATAGDDVIQTLERAGQQAIAIGSVAERTGDEEQVQLVGSLRFS